jgi:hypothetical protein
VSPSTVWSGLFNTLQLRHRGFLHPGRPWPLIGRGHVKLSCDVFQGIGFEEVLVTGFCFVSMHNKNGDRVAIHNEARIDSTARVTGEQRRSSNGS